MANLLMKGNEAIGETAIRSGCKYYFGYPITPQSELLEYMAAQLPKRDGVFVQSESEVSGISMLYGAAAGGFRGMTSSSSPGMSLMQECISYLASAELPSVIVNISRASPGLGRITPAQSDYFQACKGGGHGDYHMIVLAPASVQEMAELTSRAFYLGDFYRTPVMILGDAYIGQMMEAIPEESLNNPYPSVEKTWAATSPGEGERHLVLSAPFTNEELIDLNVKLTAKYKEIAEKETSFESFQTEDADVVLVAFGAVSRFCKSAIEQLRAEGIKAGLLRPITLFPFPSQILNQLADTAKVFLDVEMNEGQMLEDVRLAVNGKKPVEFLGGGGGRVTPPNEIADKVRELCARMKQEVKE